MASRLALLACFLLAAACGRTTLQNSVADQHGAVDETAELDFFDGLAAVPAVSNNDALHALVLSFAPQGEADFNARLEVARSRGWIAADEELTPNETARVGWIAKAVCIEAGIKGGLTMRVLGPRERYAVHELNYREWLPEMSRHQSLSGAKLISLLGSAEDHLSQTGDTPKEDL